MALASGETNVNVCYGKTYPIKHAASDLLSLKDDKINFLLFQITFSRRQCLGATHPSACPVHPTFRNPPPLRAGCIMRETVLTGADGHCSAKVTEKTMKAKSAVRSKA